MTGQEEEIAFWRYFVGTDRFRKNWCMESPNPELNPEIDILLCRLAQERGTIKVLDVGSGPVSILSRCSASDKMLLTAADPLADEYANLLPSDIGQFDVTVPVRAMAEGLTDCFEENQFDVSHIRNALDHTSSPMDSLRELHRVTKVNGIIVVHGFEDEGSWEKWQGMHQWNIGLSEGGNLTISDKSGLVADSGSMFGDSAKVIYSRKFTQTPQAVDTKNWIVCVLEKA
jgi:SAM-dependent methyltransferase